MAKAGRLKAGGMSSAKIPFAGDLRRSKLQAIPEAHPFRGLRGRIMMPGRYEIRLIAAGQSLSVPLEVRTDPRTKAAPQQFKEQDQFFALVERDLADRPQIDMSLAAMLLS